MPTFVNDVFYAEFFTPRRKVGDVSNVGDPKMPTFVNDVFYAEFFTPRRKVGGYIKRR